METGDGQAGHGLFGNRPQQSPTCPLTGSSHEATERLSPQDHAQFGGGSTAHAMYLLAWV